jgi:hypothetical protein
VVLWDEATYPSSLVAAFRFGSHDCLKMVQKGGDPVDLCTSDGAGAMQFANWM